MWTSLIQWLVIGSDLARCLVCRSLCVNAEINWRKDGLTVVYSEENLQIGALAKQLAISTRTIRYYEEIGLMGDPDRAPGVARSYSSEDVIRLKFILKLKELGIKLNEMKDIAGNYELNNQATDKILPQLIEILANHLRDIDEKIENLQTLRNDINDYSQRIVDLLQKTGMESSLCKQEASTV